MCVFSDEDTTTVPNVVVSTGSSSAGMNGNLRSTWKKNPNRLKIHKHEKTHKKLTLTNYLLCVYILFYPKKMYPV